MKKHFIIALFFCAFQGSVYCADSNDDRELAALESKSTEVLILALKKYHAAMFSKRTTEIDFYAAKARQHADAVAVIAKKEHIDSADISAATLAAQKSVESADHATTATANIRMYDPKFPLNHAAQNKPKGISFSYYASVREKFAQEDAQRARKLLKELEAKY